MNFVEHVAIASKEVVFSAAIAWLLGESSPLDLDKRLTLIAEAFALNFQDRGVAGIVAETEWRKIDVLLTLENEDHQVVGRIAIENKINATEHGRQLQNYSATLADAFPDADVRKVFLTVCGETPRDADDWAARSYTHLRDGLDAVMHETGMLARHRDSVYVQDIQEAVHNIVDLVADAQNPNIAMVAFRDMEPDDVGDQELRQKAQYLRSARLEKLTQRLWMTSLAARLDILQGWECPPVEETRGQALLNIQHHIQVHGYNLTVGIQVQRKNLKLFCRPHPYGGVTPQEHLNAVNGVLAQFLQDLPNLQGVQQPQADGLGFASFRWCEMPDGREIGAWRQLIQNRIDTLMDVPL